ncbi:DMT family transporter, partial [Suipraeoptans intestinalis]|uniref:DMT family transporter n=1 Tax=Suipraeoptans intestinalis TaxID=2606628 RepID=UPI0023F4E52D
IVFFFSVFSCVVTLPFFLFQFHPMSARQVGILLLAGMAAAGGQFSITAAYCHAPAREISIYDYSQIIFAALLGFFVFGQVPDLLSFAGYGVICAAAAGMFFLGREKR